MGKKEGGDVWGWNYKEWSWDQHYKDKYARFLEIKSVEGDKTIDIK